MPTQAPPLDHIASLRRKQQLALEQAQASARAQKDAPRNAEVAPMQELPRAMPYNLHRAPANNTGSASVGASPLLARAPLSTDPHSAASRLGVTRPLLDPSKMASLREACAPDTSTGYMSDGDILKNKSTLSGASDVTSGYVSEGGVSMYAKKLQQR